jgi:bacterioferritin-associated ferredoxin
MQPDEHVCYCYHVSLRKLRNFARRTQPQRPSQMTECLGAGTGCGWCIPFLVKIAKDPDDFSLADMAAGEYAARRDEYRRSDKTRNTF